MQKKVQSVTVVFDDGTEATYSSIEGFLRITNNNMPRKTDQWKDYEIRWTDRTQSSED